ncbi:MAG: hypothetical protein K6A23_01060 [Butyrivibrio sp.]|nr:hypothetical protein [Butyrivibrio sp.]
MKKSFASLMLGFVSLSMVACGSSNTETDVAAVNGTDTAVEATLGASKALEEESGEESATIANPWSDISELEAASYVPNGFSAPEGATNVVWSKMETGEDPILVQLAFDYEGTSFTAREQMTCDENADISGLYYEWVDEAETTLSKWAGGMMPAKLYRYIGTDEYVDLCTWFDFETGASYSLSAVAPDLDGFDIQAVVEAIYDESKQESALIPDEEDQHVPMDITGCDTFTQIVDKLEDGNGYGNAQIAGQDVLLVAQDVYDYDGNGTYVAIDADVYTYLDGTLTYAGYVTGGGTAYPLAVGNDWLYVGGNHFMRKMTLELGMIFIDEEAYVEYDANGNGVYYYHSDLHDVEADENNQVEDDTLLNSFYDEYMDAEMVVFNKIVK